MVPLPGPPCSYAPSPCQSRRRRSVSASASIRASSLAARASIRALSWSIRALTWSNRPGICRTAVARIATVAPKSPIAAQATASIGQRLAPPSDTESSQVDPPGEERGGRIDPIQDQDAVQVVELVQGGPRFESVHAKDPAPPVRVEPGQGDAAGPPHVRCEVGHREAALPGESLAFGLQELGIEQDDQTVRRRRLTVAGDVDGESPDRLADPRL